MSDVQMDTPDGSHYGNRHSRLAKPDLYFGDRAKLETWILQFDRYYHMAGDHIEKDDEVINATSYMKGDAEKWVTPLLRRYMDADVDDKENQRLFESWDSFKVKLRQVFSPIKEALVAKQKIQTLQQTKSAADYTTTFQQYSAALEWDDGALMEMYKQGLKPTVRIELMRSGTVIKTLEDLMNEAIRIDNDLYELRLEEQTYAARSRFNGREPRETRAVPNQGRRRFTPNQGQRRFNPRPQQQGFYQSRGPEPMHLDMIHQGKPKKEFGKKQGNRDNKSKGNCYNCDKPGHFARDCKLKNKVVRYLNVLRAVPIKEEPIENWEMMEIDENPTQLQVFIDAAHNVQQEMGLQNYYENCSPEVQNAIEPMLQGRSMMEAIEQHISDGHLTPVPSTEINRMVRENSPPSESDDDWTAARRQALREAYRRKNHIADRAPTPHPGDRIRGHWDEEMITTDQYPEEKALTPEELAIQTPPDSPKLVRQNATLREDHTTPPQKAGTKRKSKALPRGSHKGLIIDEQEGWVDTTLREEALRQETIRKSVKTLSPKTNRYLEDSRNHLHGILSWLSCYDDNCIIHQHSKEAQSYYPSNRKICKYKWYECEKDTCASHLHDKRRTEYFANVNKELDVQGNCFHRLWQTCLNAGCIRHFEEKIANGYGTSNAFLGSCLAPGISPGTIVTQAPGSSLPPQ
jgi:hypothetical protein